MPIYQYAIGAGYNVAAMSLVNIESIVPTGQRALYPPQSFGTYDPGSPSSRGTGVGYYRGFPSLSWDWIGNPGGWMTYAGARLIRATYLSSAWSAPVTINTKLDNETSYSRCNAIATIKRFSDSAPNFKVFNKFSIEFTRVVPL